MIKVKTTPELRKKLAKLKKAMQEQREASR